MRPLPSLIVGIVGLSLAAASGPRFAPLSFQQKPKEPAAGAATPKQTEKDRVEREIQGVWSVIDCVNPKISPILRSSGFMMVQDGWLMINAVITTKNKDNSEWDYNFVGSAKNYSIAETNRLRLVDVWGFSNDGGELKPDVGGVIEERTLQFIGAPEIGQRLIIARGSNDSLTFVRKTLPPKPPVAPPNDK
ncbi:MAG: hypothetical protein HY286_04420 [Planctomycetes bacterium]|nr:hypothetical protein [Planctomycetota bacterium]